MTLEEQLTRQVEKRLAMEDLADCFLIDISISKQKKVLVTIDADHGVTFEKCRLLSRYLEEILDRENYLGEDYTLDVSSPGVDRPLVLPRQYRKNIGRTLTVQTLDGQELEGLITEADAESVALEIEEIVKEGNKKIRSIQQKKIRFDNIKKAVLKIKF